MATLTTPGPAVSAGPGPAPAPRVRRGQTRKRVEIAVFVAPALILFIGFVIVPVILAAVYSFYNLPAAFQWDDLAEPERFVGFDNYVRALTTPEFQKAIANTFFILIMSLLVQGPIAIGVALLLNRRLRGRAVFRLLIFVPYVLAEVIAGLAWRLILQPTGAVNATLEAIGLGDLARNWLADPAIALWTIFFILTWKYIGFAILLFLAGLQGIPDELAEAAQIDGATWWQVQRHITLPLLGPTLRIWAFLSIIGSLQVFDMVWITVTPAVRRIATETMATYMVQQGQFAGQPGYGSAIAVILFVISLVIALVYQRFALRRDLAGAVTRGVR
ncbi:raffinose/stachyose/melibiose transport system permease protein [Microbacterium terrae]|uniref:L-arabinose transport system permease protein AraP n=1 Tax=Microbacterium terrae TaxID=69369 RepID=A0A0M2HLE1_9MICO|nr:sugar ABC transporter permease [Microbacterium terrae]KJL45235.1 L-arabinose transport system permease protein AraP [Microbacterium terrae]MBP1078404.1 raffinose/stachyose/melibiose transport system permease protein [Microbacterium terrae]GLJ99304.1 sugar ABC transporter permease [Microbacterium terrae]